MQDTTNHTCRTHISNLFRCDLHTVTTHGVELRNIKKFHDNHINYYVIFLNVDLIKKKVS